MSRIITRDSEGRENGWLIPLWNALEQPDLRPEQVYLTVVKPGMRKGPHLHKKRRGVFAVIRGCVEVVYLDLFTGDYVERLIVPGDDAVQVEPGSPCAIYNAGIDDAYVINMPSPAWSKEDPDDWPVEEWKDPEWWKPIEINCEVCGRPIDPASYQRRPRVYVHKKCSLKRRMRKWRASKKACLVSA